MKRRQSPFRIRWGAVALMPPYGDVGPFEATINQHPYLHCHAHGCGARLWYGETTTGAPIYVCRACKRTVDARRIA